MRWIVAAGWVLLLVTMPFPAGGRGMTPREREVLDEVNRLRADPPAYATVVEDRGRHLQGRLLVLPGRVPLRTVEGRAAFDDAARALRAARAAPALRASTGLAAAARDHAADVGGSGRTGHDGSDGSRPSERIRRHGRWIRAVGEVIAFGENTPREVVTELVVDDGVPSRGHRQLLLDPALRVAGVACGPHEKYVQVCVIDLAARFVERGGED